MYVVWPKCIHNVPAYIREWTATYLYVMKNTLKKTKLQYYNVLLKSDTFKSANKTNAKLHVSEWETTYRKRKITCISALSCLPVSATCGYRASIVIWMRFMYLLVFTICIRVRYFPLSGAVKRIMDGVRALWWPLVHCMKDRHHLWVYNYNLTYQGSA